MLTGNTIYRPLGRLALLIAAAALTCGALHAQSDSSPQPASNAQSTASTTPEAPIGTSFAAASGDTPVQADTSIPSAGGADYRIGADDILAINVWHEPEVSRQVPVRPDGRISLPLVGDVKAAGLTPTQLQNELQSRFSKFLTDPAISVIVAEIRSQRYNVLGQVLRPGTYPLIPPISVVDAIASAGGLKEFAKPSKIYILRTLPNGQRERIRIHYKDILNGKRGSQDFLIETRDTVVVP